MIEVSHLSKRYGDNYVLQDISFSVNRGEIVGFLGPNGAGKSTTLNILTGYLSLSSGSVSICSMDVLDFPGETKRKIGYLPEIPPLYPEMTVREYLCFVYRLKGCTLKRDDHINEVLDVVKLRETERRLIGNLSKGYRQRVGIAGALIGNPEIIILDEPTAGLDPRQIVEVRNLIRTLGLDHTVILSTHILSEVQAVCDRVIVINRGRIVADRKTEELSLAVKGNRLMTAKICGPQKEVISALRSLPGVFGVECLGNLEGDNLSYRIESSGDIDIRKPLFSLLSRNDWPLVGLEASGANLEDVFLSLTDKPSAPKRGRAGTR